MLSLGLAVQPRVCWRGGTEEAAALACPDKVAVVGVAGRGGAGGGRAQVDLPNECLECLRGHVTRSMAFWPKESHSPESAQCRWVCRSHVTARRP